MDDGRGEAREGDPSLYGILRAVLDGHPLDWSSAVATVPVPQLVEEFRLLARIADVYRAGPSSAHERPLPSDWGHLTLLEAIGEGTSGSVYRAWDSRLDREVALKLVPDTNGEGAFASSIIQEGRLLARVRHPGVITVFGAERRAGEVGVWMELIRGRTLEDELRERGPIPVSEAVVIGRELCGALGAVHAAGVIHRDVKAQNVMREGKRLVLMDFGAGRDDHTKEMAIAGTPLYLAPELFEGAKADVRSDVYALGVLLYHLVTGDYPVTGRTLAEVRRAHAAGVLHALEAPAHLPRRFRRVLAKALAPAPAARFGSAAEMARALEARWPARIKPDSSVLAGAVGIGVVLAVVVTIEGGRRATPPSGSGESRARAFDALPGDATIRRLRMPADAVIHGDGFSRDGRSFVYTTFKGNVAVLDLATMRTDALTGPDEGGAQDCVVSPRGQSVVCEWETEGGEQLRRLSREGAAAQILVEDAGIDYIHPVEWTADGHAVLCVRAWPGGISELALIDVPDGHVEPLWRFPSAPSLHATMSPDSRYVVFDAPRADGGGRNLFLLDVATRTAQPLLAAPADDRAPFWAPDGRRVLFLSDRSGTTDAWAVAVENGHAVGDPELLVRNLQRAELLSLPVSGALYFALQTEVYDVCTVPLDTATGWPSGPAAVLPSRASGRNAGPSWSPDGRLLAYTSERGSEGDPLARVLVVRDMATGLEREVPAAIGLGAAAPQWSPNGRTLLVRGFDERGRAGYFAVTVETGDVKALLMIDRLSHLSDYGRAAWSADGGSIVYQHEGRLVSRVVATGEERILPREEGAVGLDLSPYHGLRAFAPPGANGSGQALYLQSPGAPAREVVRVWPPERVAFQAWMPAGDAFLFTRFDPARRGSQQVWRATIDGRAPVNLGLAIDGYTQVNRLQVRPDGGAIAFTRGGASNRGLWVVEHVLPSSPPHP